MHDAIVVKNLRKTFLQDIRQPGILGSIKSLFSRQKRHIEAVKDISFTIAPGSFVGFLGPNGAGKTTTLKMLSGILHPTSGSATVLGHVPWKRQESFQKRFSLVMGQKNQLWWDLPVIESFKFNKAVYEISDKTYAEQSTQLIELLDIGRLMDSQVRKLSLGERMKCELAVALLHKPDVLLLDEPTIGLDVVSQKNIREFLQQYNREEKATIILTSHYMEDIRRLCERVLIIDHGQLIYDGSYHKLVDQYANTKTIEISLSEKIAQEKFTSFGSIMDYRETSVRLNVPRTKVTEITTQLLNTFPIDDISIHEETMEEIVSGIFTNGR